MGCPMRMSYGVSFVNSKYNLCTAIAILMCYNRLLSDASVDDLVQDCSISRVLALEILHFAPSHRKIACVSTLLMLFCSYVKLTQNKVSCLMLSYQSVSLKNLNDSYQLVYSMADRWQMKMMLNSNIKCIDIFVWKVCVLSGNLKKSESCHA